MNIDINIFQLITYFIIYSFLGWVMESIVRTIAERKLLTLDFYMDHFVLFTDLVPLLCYYF